MVRNCLILLYHNFLLIKFWKKKRFSFFTLYGSIMCGINPQPSIIMYISSMLLFASQQWQFKYETEVYTYALCWIVFYWVWLRAFATQRLPTFMQLHYNVDLILFAFALCIFLPLCVCARALILFVFFLFWLHALTLNSLGIKYAFLCKQLWIIDLVCISPAVRCTCELSWELAKKNRNYEFTVYV